MVRSVKEFSFVTLTLWMLIVRSQGTRYRPLYSFLTGQQHIFPQLSEDIRNQSEYSNNIYFIYYNKWVFLKNAIPFHIFYGKIKCNDWMNESEGEDSENMIHDLWSSVVCACLLICFFLITRLLHFVVVYFCFKVML